MLGVFIHFMINILMIIDYLFYLLHKELYHNVSVLLCEITFHDTIVVVTIFH